MPAAKRSPVYDQLVRCKAEVNTDVACTDESFCGVPAAPPARGGVSRIDVLHARFHVMAVSC
ncbi:hypothetical protein SRIMM317S_05719 [Streptomyces rimosus subsp. rimosus]